MPRKKRRIFAAFVIVLTALLIVSALYFITMLKLEGPSPGTAAGRRELQAIAASATPLTNALTRFRQANGKFPASLTELSPTYFKGRVSDRWVYDADGKNNFSLYYKLDWDAGLRYEFSSANTNSWIYDPGNGNPLVTILPEN